MLTFLKTVAKKPKIRPYLLVRFDPDLPSKRRVPRSNRGGRTIPIAQGPAQQSTKWEAFRRHKYVLKPQITDCKYP